MGHWQHHYIHTAVQALHTPSSSSCSGGSHCTQKPTAAKHSSQSVTTVRRQDTRSSCRAFPHQSMQVETSDTSKLAGLSRSHAVVPRTAHAAAWTAAAAAAADVRMAAQQHGAVQLHTTKHTPLVVFCQALLVREISAAGAAVETSIGPAGVLARPLLNRRHGNRTQQM